MISKEQKYAIILIIEQAIGKSNIEPGCFSDNCLICKRKRAENKKIAQNAALLGIKVSSYNTWLNLRVEENEINNREFFEYLKQDWEKDTLSSSDISDITEHPSYRRIIEMGEVALPFIFESMRKELGHWFYALNTITGINPCPKECAGNLQKMTDHWLKWANENNFIKTL